MKRVWQEPSEMKRMRQEPSSLGECKRTRINEWKQTDRGMKKQNNFGSRKYLGRVNQKDSTQSGAAWLGAAVGDEQLGVEAVGAKQLGAGPP